MTSKSKWFFALIGAASLMMAIVSVVIAPPARASDVAEQRAIVETMKAIFHRPEAPLEVGPISIEGDAAVAGWSQAEIGGRAFLRKRKDVWSIILCSGDQLRDVQTLVVAGVPKSHAERLAAKIAEVEKSIPPARLALFGKFDGLVKVEDGQTHPTHKR